VKSKQDIQKTSVIQLLIVFGFIAYIFLIGSLFNQQFAKKPHDLFEINKTSKSK